MAYDGLVMNMPPQAAGAIAWSWSPPRFAAWLVDFSPGEPIVRVTRIETRPQEARRAGEGGAKSGAPPDAFRLLEQRNQIARQHQFLRVSLKGMASRPRQSNWA